jgi:lipid II:glycine glycyltransferase (peptidoglycan interpeptide bridge formation enzyme)
MARQRLLFFPSKTYLSALQHRLKDNLRLYTAVHDSKVQGAAVIVYNHLGAFYYYGGSVERPYRGSMNLMHYDIMKDLKRMNIPVYDFMGARIVTGGDPKIEGIQTFKSRFATGMRRGHTFRYIINPLRHRMFVLAVKGYFALKGCRYNGDFIDQARHNPGESIADIPALPVNSSATPPGC